MPLSQEEWKILDKDVSRLGNIQVFIANINKNGLVNNPNQLYKFIKTYTKESDDFIAYFILQVPKLRYRKNELLGTLLYKIITKCPQKTQYVDELFKESNPLLRIVYDMGGITKEEIYKRKANEFQCFADLFDNTNNKFKYDNVDKVITKDMIYNIYLEGTVERAIYDKDPNKMIEIMQAENKTKDTKINVSPFFKYDEAPTLLELACHCNSKLCVEKLLEDIEDGKHLDSLMNYCIMSGKSTISDQLTAKYDLSISGRYYIAASYYNIDCCCELDDMGESEFVWRNIQSMYNNYSLASGQLTYDDVYSMLKYKPYNIATKWFLCVQGISMYATAKYASAAVSYDNEEMAHFILEQGDSSLLSDLSSSSDFDDIDNDDDNVDNDNDDD